MNSVFDIRRFLRVLGKDIREGVRQNWSLPLIFIGTYVVVWVLNTFVTGRVTAVGERRDYFLLLSAVFCAIIPSSLYRRVNDRSEGVWFALLPASKFEKYCVLMLVSTLLWPAGYLLLLGATDVLLSLIGGPEWGYIGIVCREAPFGYGDFAFLLMCTTFFTCGNLLFHTRRVGKSLLVVLVLFLTAGIVRRLFPDWSPGCAEYILPLSVTPVLWLTGYVLFCRMEY